MVLCSYTGVLSFVAARTDLHAIRSTKTITARFLVIKSGKAKSFGDWHALVNGRSM